MSALLAVSLGTFLHLDRYAIGQTLIHRPTVVGVLLGYIGGFPLEGALMGVVMEFVGLFQPPTGSDLPQDETAMAVIAFSSAIAFSPHPVSALPLAVALSLPTAAAARDVERRCRYVNQLIQHRVERSGRHIERNIARALWLALLARLALMFAFLSSSALIVYGLLHGLAYLGWWAFFDDWARKVVLLIPLIGVGYELFRPGARRRVGFLAAGVAAGVLLGFAL